MLTNKIKNLFELDEYYKTKNYLFIYTIISFYILMFLKILLIKQSIYVFWPVYTIFSVFAVKLLVNYATSLKKQHLKIKNFEGFYINYGGFYLKLKRDYIKSCFVFAISLFLQIYIFLFSIEVTTFRYEIINWLFGISVTLLLLIICVFKFQGSFFMTLIITFSNIAIFVILMLAVVFLIIHIGGEDGKGFIIGSLLFILSWGNATEVLILVAVVALSFQIFIISNRPPSTLESTKSALKIINIISTITLAFILLYLNTVSDLLYSYTLDSNIDSIEQLLKDLKINNIEEFKDCIRKIITLVLLPFTSGNAIATLAVDYIDQKYKKRSKKDYLKGFEYFIEDQNLDRAEIYFKKSVYYGGSTYEIQLRTNPLLLPLVEGLMTKEKLDTRLKKLFRWIKEKLIAFKDYIISIIFDLYEDLKPSMSQTNEAFKYLSSEWKQGNKKRVILAVLKIIILFGIIVTLVLLSVRYNFLQKYVDTIFNNTNIFIEKRFDVLSDRLKGILTFTVVLLIAIINILHALIQLKNRKLWNKIFFLIMRFSISLLFLSIGLSILFPAHEYTIVQNLSEISSFSFPISILIFVLFKNR